MSLDRLVDFPSVFSITTEQLEEAFDVSDNGNMRWLTTDKTRAYMSRSLYGNHTIDLSLFSKAVPVEECVIDLTDGKVSLVTVSIFNRGDGGNISLSDFKERFQTTGKEISKSLKARPVVRKVNKRQGLLSEGYGWNGKTAIAALEHNEGALSGSNAEFLRLRFARKGLKSSLAKSILSRKGAAVRLSDLPKNVEKKKDGAVYVKGIPMVDQGNKGYCVVASVQRLFEYYGLGADMHQIAEVANADPDRGTSSLQMAKELDAIDFRFKTRLDIIAMADSRGQLTVPTRDFKVGKDVNKRKFDKEIRSYIDKGIPLLWSLDVGLYPETPSISKQASGGHMRMIIGYNETDDTYIFSDSWGAGHEFKIMKRTDAYAATKGLFALKPVVH